MKKIFVFTACLFVAFISFAQQNSKFKPDLKPGLTFEYVILSQGQEIPLIMKIATINDSGIVLDYDIQNGGALGKFVNAKANLEKGVSTNWDQPIAGEERTPDETQTIGMVSRPFLKSLKEQQKGKYDGMDFAVKTVPAGKEIMVGGKEMDVIYAESADGGSKMWILNNDLYPVLLKIEGTVPGIDMIIKDIR